MSMKDHSKKSLRVSLLHWKIFLKSWSSTDKKEPIIKELEDHGVFGGYFEMP
ncbi:MAG: hypothetical protein IPH57_17985 [Saprospiraceae bacterium]|nr:hypothetical protein [Saprospiraceae bacterium]